MSCTEKSASKFSVGAHGNPKLIVDQDGNVLTPQQLAKKIKSNPKYSACMPVDLLSCNTGKGANSYAQKLANELGATVTAPDNYLWYYSDGRTVPAGMNKDRTINLSDKGKMNDFKPDEKSKKCK